ncbi:MAG: hypothetical protein J07HX5_00244 [halophilic archaeon J07HX5]|nr:MAG: hypothetical protein J07HX5_00244 [halophilic archaeon J07HX5]
MYPRLKSWASPHKGFRPTLHDCHGRVARQRSARRTVLFGRGVLSPGFIRRGVGVWKRTFATATRHGDRLTHTGLIPGVLSNAVTSRTVDPCRSGDGLDPGFGSLPGYSIRGRITSAPVPGPVWTQHSITTRTLEIFESIENQPANGPKRGDPGSIRRASSHG